jgi:hypothetical protein
MPRSDKVKPYFKTKAANAPVDNDDTDIPAGKTIIFKMADFTAPAQQMAGVKIYVGPTGSPNVLVSAAQGDKVVHFPPGQVITGPKTVRLQLDNSNNPNGALLGVALYYEEV